MGRIKALQLIILFIVILILARLFYWQFISEAATLNNNNQQLVIPAPRGDIYASDGFPLATNQEAFSLFAKLSEIDEDHKKIAEVISPLLIEKKYSTPSAGLNDDEKKIKEEQQNNQQDIIIKKLSEKSLFWVQLARKFTKDEKEIVEKNDFNGLIFQKDTKRLYPEASMAAHLLGFVGSDDHGEDIGYFGLEGNYNNILKGRDGRIGQENDPLGFPILVGKYKPLDPKKGSSITTSIDRSIQFIVENKLKESVEKYGAKEGLVIVAEPKSGNIVAMANYPNYDPNYFSEFTQDKFRNPAVADTYEPGSTFKLITMAAALDLEKIAPQTICDVCSGPREVGGYQISTWNKKYYPNSTMTEVLQHSDNVGMTFISDKLGVNNFLNYIKKFGFGKNTGIDLQEEVAGVVRNKEDWKEIDLATASFGQGIAVTPIQMIQAVQAIANGGTMISPRIVTKITDEAGKIKQIEPQKIDVISKKTASQVTEMMVTAVMQGETKAFVPEGYNIAGKTGTAQIPVAGHYDPNKTIASFIGFAPAQDPRFVMLVRFTEPTSSIFGSETAAPTFFSIAKEILTYLEVSPN